jgi:hypothetical protein
MQWINVKEHVPEEGKLLLSYSEVYGSYLLAKWCSGRGWLTQDNEDIKIVSHWCDLTLPFTFPITEKPDEEAAQKWGLKIQRTLFS